MPTARRWVLGVEVVAPAAGAALVTVAAVAGEQHYVHGAMFGKEDAVANVFELREAATKRFGWSTGMVPQVSDAPYLTAAVNVAISLNVLNASAAGISHWGGLLVETR